jgi:hypothetical protein
VLHQKLGLTAVAYAGVYLFVDYVALATSGSELMKETAWWYVMAAPPVFAGFCVLTASVHMTSKRLLPLGIVAHVLVAPAVYPSMLFLGVFLPVLSYLWWRVFLATRRQESTSGQFPDPRQGTTDGRSDGAA